MLTTYQVVDNCCTTHEYESVVTNHGGREIHPGFETQHRCHLKAETWILVAHRKELSRLFLKQIDINNEFSPI